MRFATAISLTSLATACGALAAVWAGPGALDHGPWRAQLDRVQDRLQSAARAPGPTKTIYLNREGVTLTAGRDDARMNRSALVPSDGASVPAFTGSDRTWRAFVKCVERKVAPFDVRVVDQRPVVDEYMMVAVGGRRKHLDGASGHHIAGLAPYNGAPIANAVVFVFASTLSNRATDMCETASQEIGHAYGLDHARHCSDLMTYMPRCGARQFLDRDLVCGEHAGRECKNGEARQNSYAHLLRVLGPRV